MQAHTITGLGFFFLSRFGLSQASVTCNSKHGLRYCGSKMFSVSYPRYLVQLIFLTHDRSLSFWTPAIYSSIDHGRRDRGVVGSCGERGMDERDGMDAGWGSMEEGGRNRLRDGLRKNKFPRHLVVDKS